MPTADSARPLTVTVVGGGPKALYCVERLISRALLTGPTVPGTDADGREGGSTRGGPPVRLVVWDSDQNLAYARTTPSTWRLNVTSRIVDVAVRDGAAPTPFALPSFDTWRAAQPGTADAEAWENRDESAEEREFPPRALVGHYLAEQWRTVLAHAPDGWEVELRRGVVTEVTRDAGGWRVAGERFDEVLLATGHARTWDGALAASDELPDLVGHVYPPDEVAGIAPGATVVVRGMALTFIDVALLLTADRAPGERVARLVPTSRSGLFMVPKPHSAWVSRLHLADLHEPAAERLSALREPDVRAVLAEVEGLAGAYLRRARAARAAHAPAGPVPIAWLERRGHGRRPLEQLDHDIAVAQGAAVPDEAWALGQAWRDLYGVIVDVISFAPLAPQEWQEVADAASTLEPVAFGPPLLNARRIQALGRAGVVDDSAAAAGLDEAQAARRARAGGADVVVVDAVLPPPGITDGVVADLAASGLLTRAPGRRGVLVDRDLRCLDAGSTPIRGLSAVGRPTEDVVLGNDTLNRSLHDGPDRWARRILEETS